MKEKARLFMFSTISVSNVVCVFFIVLFGHVKKHYKKTLKTATSKTSQKHHVLFFKKPSWGRSLVGRTHALQA